MTVDLTPVKRRDLILTSNGLAEQENTGLDRSSDKNIGGGAEGGRGGSCPPLANKGGGKRCQMPLISQT